MQEVKSRSYVMLEDELTRSYKHVSIAQIKQEQIIERAVLRLVDDVELYASNHTPNNFYNGIADVSILYRLIQVLLTKFYAPDTPYVAGSITAEIYQEGVWFGEMTNILQQINTKFAITHAVDLQAWLNVSAETATPVKGVDAIGKELVYLWLMSPDKRAETIKRLKAYTMPNPVSPTSEDVKNAVAQVIRGKGTVILPDNAPYAVALRSFALLMIRELVSQAFADPTSVKHEYFTDVMSAISLFMIYINVTESDDVYDTAFPPISANGNNPIIMDKTTSTIRQLALLFTKSSLIHRGFSASLAINMIQEIIALIPKGFDNLTPTTATMDPSGALKIEMDKSAHANVFLAKLKLAEDVVNNVLPPVIKDYIPDVIKSIKSHSSADYVVTDLMNQITTTQTFDKQGARTLFSSLLTAVVAKAHVISDPEESIPADLRIISYVQSQDFVKFIMAYIYPAIDGIYFATSSLQSAYDELMKNIGGAFGAVIPGVNLELKLEKSSETDLAPFVPVSDDIMQVQYAKINKRYEWPWVIQPLVVHDDGGKYTQKWIFSDLLFKLIKPKSVVLKMAMDKDDLRRNMHKDFLVKDLWSWPDHGLPVPTYLNEVLFAYQPLPFVYTGTRIFDRFSPKANKLDNFMTANGKYPNSNLMEWSEFLYLFANSSTLNVANLALALAGVGFFYERKDLSKASWTIVNPLTPTIYGMPTIFMMHRNELNLSDFLIPSDSDPGRFYLNPSAKDLPGADRILFDSSLTEGQVGNYVFVMHKYVPKMQRVTRHITWLRHGFIVDLPYIKDFYASIEDLTQKSTADQKARWKESIVKSDNKLQLTPRIDVANSFRYLFTTFFNDPSGSTKFNASTYFAELQSPEGSPFKKFTKLDDLYNAYFVETHGWSKVIVPFPHLTMNNTFVLPLKEGDNSLLDPYASKIFVSDYSYQSGGLMKWLSLYNPKIVMLDFNDQINIERSDIFSPQPVGTIVNQDLRTAGTNQHVNDGDIQHTITQEHKSTEGIEVSTDVTGDPMIKSSINRITTKENVNSSDIPDLKKVSDFPSDKTGDKISARNIPTAPPADAEVLKKDKLDEKEAVKDVTLDDPKKFGTGDVASDEEEKDKEEKEKDGKKKDKDKNKDKDVKE